MLTVHNYYAAKQRQKKLKCKKKTEIYNFFGFVLFINSVILFFLQRPGTERRYTYRSICKDSNGQMRILHGLDCRRQVALGRFRNAINSTGLVNKILCCSHVILVQYKKFVF